MIQRRPRRPSEVLCLVRNSFSIGSLWSLFAFSVISLCSKGAGGDPAETLKELVWVLGAPGEVESFICAGVHLSIRWQSYTDIDASHREESLLKQ